VINSWHDWHTEHAWHDITRLGGHPLVFNARGTHATYDSQGIHGIDWTEMKEKWDLWKDLDVIFPWDWNKADRVVSTDSNINGANYLTHVYYWGNEAKGPSIAGEGPRVDGPDGWLNKFMDRKAELEATGFSCQGTDTERCPWPMGVFSDYNPLCRPGFFFSYLSQKCQQKTPAKMPSCAKAVDSIVSEKLEALTLIQAVASGIPDTNATCQVSTDECGDGYQAVCQFGDDEECTAGCMAQKIADAIDYPHMICSKDGAWIDSAAYPEDAGEVTFASAD